MTTITPKKFFPPKTEGWSHNILAADGNYYGCKEAMISMFQIGQPIDVEVTVTEKNGRTYRDIKKVLPNANGQPTQRPSSSWRGEDAGTSERIYVCGIVNSYVQHLGKFQGEGDLTEALVSVTQAARASWRATFGKSQP